MERVERIWTLALGCGRGTGAEAVSDGAAAPMTGQKPGVGDLGSRSCFDKPSTNGSVGELSANGGVAHPGTNGGIADLDDRGLVTACVSGNPDAFDIIVERHRRTIYQLCYRFVGNHEDASDLAQEVFLRAYRGLRNFKGEASLATWLYRIGVNASLNKLSSRPPVAEPLDASQPVVDREPDPARRLLEDERSRRVRTAIGRLPKKQRETLILRVYHDLPHQEIAAIVGSSVGAVKANFFHALRNLKRILSEDPV